MPGLLFQASSKMSLRKLTIQGIRNLEQADIIECGQVNIFTGLNGSGKTSLLEAIYILARGKSFRSARLNAVINHLATRCVVFGECETPEGLFTLGVMRSRGQQQLFKINGIPVYAASQLAEILPLQLIHADTFSLLEGGPRARRQFLDWGVFHVEQDFLPLWRRAQKALKHRNALLRHAKIKREEIAPWENELVFCAEAIDHLRSRYVDRLKPLFLATLESLADLPGVTLDYKRGWPDGLGLSQALQRDAQRDALQGTTHSGPHRADLDIRVDGHPADEVLSRGQEKLLVCALRIAQGQLLNRLTGKTCLYLVDDLPAELDLPRRQALCRQLTSINSQVFVTATDPASFTGCWPERTGTRWFHVEHGRITACQHGLERN